MPARCARGILVIIESGPVRRLGVEQSAASLRFGEEPKVEGAWAGRRLLWLGDKAAFDLTFWCGTCPVTFERLAGANGTLSIAELEQTLARGLEHIDQPVVAAFAEILPAASYLPMLLSVSPRLVKPVGDDDYFAHEQVETWGLNSFTGLPENPQTPYYRTFETGVSTSAHFYEFVVPMVPPTWNDRARVEEFTHLLERIFHPTIVAVSTLDISQPAMDNQSSDYYQHWVLTHFLLDGHHKIEAAATSGRPLQLLPFVSIDASLATEDDLRHLPAIRAKTDGPRPPRLVTPVH